MCVCVTAMCRTPAMRALNATGQARITIDAMYTVLSTPPVLQTYVQYMYACSDVR